MTERYKAALLAPLIVCVICIGCATTDGPEPVAAGAASRCRGFGASSPFVTGDHPDYPRRLYMTAGGHSCSSMDDAEKKAIRKVSEEINSELTGVFESFLGQWARESDGNSSVKLVEDVISKTRVETRFKDRHLIKIVKRQKAGDVNGAVAALDRRKAAEFLEPKVRYSGERFGAVVKQCKEAYWQADEGLMRRLTAQATTLASSTDKTLLEYAVITSRPIDRWLGSVRWRASYKTSASGTSTWDRSSRPPNHMFDSCCLPCRTASVRASGVWLPLPRSPWTRRWRP